VELHSCEPRRRSQGELAGCAAAEAALPVARCSRALHGARLLEAKVNKRSAVVFKLLAFFVMNIQDQNAADEIVSTILSVAS
jgi:hypothetical protein